MRANCRCNDVAPTTTRSTKGVVRCLQFAESRGVVFHIPHQLPLALSIKKRQVVIICIRGAVKHSSLRVSQGSNKAVPLCDNFNRDWTANDLRVEIQNASCGTTFVRCRTVQISCQRSRESGGVPGPPVPAQRPIYCLPYVRKTMRKTRAENVQLPRRKRQATARGSPYAMRQPSTETV